MGSSAGLLIGFAGQHSTVIAGADQYLLSGIAIMLTTIPRFLLAPGHIAFRSARIQILPPLPSRNLPSCRNTSTKPAKHIVLEKPEKFNPPSHPARLNRKPPRQYPGPRLSESQQQEQKTKQYPNTFPPKGTWRYWFLTNRSIHVFITLVRPHIFELRIPLMLGTLSGLWHLKLPFSM